MKFIGIIPSRYASTRFPGKPLVKIGEKTMIQRVYEQAKKCSLLSEVYVATDDSKIEKHVLSFGGKVIMTSKNHKTGTDRCAEAIKKINSTGKVKYDVVINIQGDEPFISPKQIELIISILKKDSTTEIGTLMQLLKTEYELIHAPKVVVDKNLRALYFSRSPIPHCRGVKKLSHWLKHHTYYKHIGIYAYKTSVLHQLTKLKQSPLEVAESLEQLRWIENGYTIKTAITSKYNSIAIDTPADLQLALSLIKNKIEK